MRAICCSVLLFTIISCPARNDASEAQDKEIREWIIQLGSKDFQRRNAAMQSLIKAGQPAIEAVSAVVGSKDAEVDQRAKQILIAFLESGDDRIHGDALRTLRKMSRSKNPVAERLANSLLGREKAVLPWIKRMEGEFTVDQTVPEHPIVDLRLDRTRGIDPGFTRDGLHDDDLARLKPLRNVRSLTLEYRTTMTDAGLRHLANLKKLETLNLSRTGVTGRGLANLGGLSHLRNLNLARCFRIDDKELLSLKQLKQLRVLNVDGISNAGCSDDLWMANLRRQRRSGRDGLSEYRGGITDVGLKHIGELRGLTSLSLEMTRITSQGLPSLKFSQQLQSLDLSRTVVDDEGVTHIAHLNELKSLRINFTPITDASLRKLTKLRNLEELHVRGTIITDAGLRELVGMPKIRTLDLYGTNITDASIDVLKKFPHLNALDVRRTGISFRGLLRLAQVCEKLDLKAALLAGGLARTDKDGEIVSVSLSGKEVEDADLRLLQPFARLHGISLRDTRITDDGLANLRDFVQLRSLGLANTPVTDEGLTHLKRMKSLDYLGIHGTKVTFRGVLRLFTGYQERSLAEAIQIARYRERDDDYPVLYEHDPQFFPEGPKKRLPPSQQLQRGTSPKGLVFLDLGRTGMTDADVATLLELGKLGALFLNGNPLSDSGLGQLTKCQQLEVLWASGKGISGVGLARLTSLANLHTLWLTDTKLTDRDLAQLKLMAKLRILNLSGADITDAAIAHLQACPKLGVLIVDGTAFSDAALTRLRKARPKLYIQLSQKRALAAVRGGERKEKTLPQGYHRGLEMRSVNTVVAEIPMQWIFGDAYFESAERLGCDGRYVSCLARAAHWKQLTTLKQVSVVNVPVSAETVAVLKHLPLLRNASFYRSKLDDDALAHLTGTKLEELDLQRTTITDADLVHLKGLKNLRSLSLGGYGTKINDPGIKYLSRLTELETLRLNRTNITDSALSHLKTLRNLKRLELREVRVDQGLQHIGELPHLESLDLSSTFVSDDTLTHFYGLTNLRRLDLNLTLVTEEGVRQLRERLTNVHVSSRGWISGEARRAVVPLAKLRVRMYRNYKGVFMVDLRELDDVTAAMKYVQKLKGLKDLRLGARATDQLLADIGGLTQLDKLDLTNSAVTDAGLRQLQAARGLTTLRLGDTKVGDRGVEHLLGLENLETLVLDGTAITDDAIVRLKHMTKLRVLHARRTRVTSKGVATLKKSLPDCSILWDDPTLK